MPNSVSNFSEYAVQDQDGTSRLRSQYASSIYPGYGPYLERFKADLVEKFDQLSGHTLRGLDIGI